MEAIQTLLELLQENLFTPLETAFTSVSWVNDLLALISNLLTTIFNYEIVVTPSHLASMLTLILLIVVLTAIIKLFVGAFTSVLLFYETERKGRKKRRWDYSEETKQH